MFSLQTIFGSGQQFYDLLDEAAAAAASATALHTMMAPPAASRRLMPSSWPRQRRRAASTEKIGKALVDSQPLAPRSRCGAQRVARHGPAPVQEGCQGKAALRSGAWGEPAAQGAAG